MGFSAENYLLTFREQMDIRTNVDSVPKIAKLSRKWEDFDQKLVKQQGFREQNILFRETGSSKTLLTIREQMGI